MEVGRPAAGTHTIPTHQTHHDADRDRSAGLDGAGPAAGPRDRAGLGLGTRRRVPRRGPLLRRRRRLRARRRRPAGRTPGRERGGRHLPPAASRRQRGPARRPGPRAGGRPAAGDRRGRLAAERAAGRQRAGPLAAVAQQGGRHAATARQALQRAHVSRPVRAPRLPRRLLRQGEALPLPVLTSAADRAADRLHPRTDRGCLPADQVAAWLLVAG